MSYSTSNDVRQIATPRDFDEYIRSQTINNKIALVHIELENVPVCKTVNEAMLAIIRNENFRENVTVCRLNADHFTDFLSSNNVSAVPTVLFYHRTKLIDRVDGFNQNELIKKLQSYMSTIKFNEPTLEEKFSSIEIEKKIKDLLQSAPVILFMKGSPDNPQCGFSRQACHILNEHHVKYNHFDVLSDQQIREQLKIYSNWNTYPQVF